MKIEEKFMHQFIGFKKRRGNYRALITLVLFFTCIIHLFEYCEMRLLQKRIVITMNYSNENGF